MSSTNYLWHVVKLVQVRQRKMQRTKNPTHKWTQIANMPVKENKSNTAATSSVDRQVRGQHQRTFETKAQWEDSTGVNWPNQPNHYPVNRMHSLLKLQVSMLRNILICISVCSLNIFVTIRLPLFPAIAKYLRVYNYYWALRVVWFEKHLHTCTIR